ncbi:hypothetical protein P154DRAFT_590896, partial [Amniculicola lignicola CBS 123094]
QVEYYFSDENLPTDVHLLQCCGGTENRPVSVSRICGFKKMRKFKPKSMVIAALRKSVFLEVSANGKELWRKVPLAGKTILDANDSDTEIAFDPRTKREIQLPLPPLPQTKKEYPPGMSKNMMKPTGFEEGAVEGPITPAQHEEEMALYDDAKPFVERIEIAIQRFKEKKRWHEKFNKVFNKWMRFGGVDCAPRMFGGLSKQEMAGMDAAQIAMARATHQVPWDREDPKDWVVDFDGVAAAFLSSYYPRHYGNNPEQVLTACSVLIKFFRYCDYHRVCDEFKPQLAEAEKICRRAEYELPQIYKASLSLPGAFNVAGSTIFQGYHANKFIGDSEWAKDQEASPWVSESAGMKMEKARATFKTAVFLLGTEQQQHLLETSGKLLSGLKVLKKEGLGLEVVDILPSTDEVKQGFAAANEVSKAKLHLSPLGKLVCKTWSYDTFLEYDLPKDRYPKGSLPKVAQGKTYEFWVEDEALEECFVGMKLDAEVFTLDGGITILDNVKEVMCSFFKWLPNELWNDNHPHELKIRHREREWVDEEDVVMINGEQKAGQEGDKEKEKDKEKFSDEQSDSGEEIDEWRS